jgi:hypothetical protein
MYIAELLPPTVDVNGCRTLTGRRERATVTEQIFSKPQADAVAIVS